MSWGIFGKIFKKRSSSQPTGSNARKSSSGSNKNVKGKTMNPSSSVPNLSTASKASTIPKPVTNRPPSNLKSFGEIGPSGMDSDDDTSTNYTQRSKSGITTRNTTDLQKTQDSKKSTAGYESSSSESRLSTTNDLEFLNTLTNTNNTIANLVPKIITSEIQGLQPVNIDNDSEDSKSITTISPEYTPRNQNLSLAEKIKLRQERRKGSTPRQQTPTGNDTNSNMNQTKSTMGASVKFREPEVNDSPLQPVKKIENTYQNKEDNLKPSDDKLIQENNKLRQKIEALEKQAIERERKQKQESDMLMIKFHDNLSKNMKDETERQALSRQLLSKQQESNEKLINEQSKMIDSLNLKCKRLENELKQAYESNDANYLRGQISALNEEISLQKNLIDRLSIELSAYQAKYQTPPPKDVAINDFHKNVSPKQLSPLLGAYDEKLNEKDEKLRNMKNKLDELTNKFKQILEENDELREKLDKLPDNVKTQITQIRNQATLVLEENRVMAGQLELEQKKINDLQRQHIEEIGRLSRKIVLSETERVNLLNTNDVLKSNYEELLKKYNDASIEAQRRVSLNDHLNQTGDLKRKIEDINIKNKQELENKIQTLQAIQKEKTDLNTKYIELLDENNKIKAQIKVLEKTVEDGTGRKIQRKIQELEKKLLFAQLQEKNAYSSLEKLTKESQKLKIEKENLEKLVQTSELEMQRNSNRLNEENLKSSKLEERLDDFKEKAANKLAKALEKLQKKDAELVLIKIENEKKLSEALRLLQKKQDQIDEFIKNKSLEVDLDKAYQSSSAENKKLKEILLSFKTNSDDLEILKNI